MKAIALLSGGLDSTLAIKVILGQGIEVVALNYFSPFCRCNGKQGCGHVAKKVTADFQIPLKIFCAGDEYLKIVRNPKYGYGKNLNPCLDCRILIYRRAAQLMKEIGASFIVTGEVLGQRPMSQHKAALKIIEQESGLAGLILRPLSAKLLPVTIPEERGWVDRDKLLQIQGRSRKPQISLAERYDIADYPCPAGGCLLTDPGFSRRLRDLIDYGELSLLNVNLLKIGRHFRVHPQAKLVVGRDEKENERLNNLARPGDIYFTALEDPGPVAIGRGCFRDEDIVRASGIVARYTDGQRNPVKVGCYQWPQGPPEEVWADSSEEHELQALRI